MNLNQESIITNIIENIMDNTGFAGVKNQNVATTAQNLHQGVLSLPRQKETFEIPISKLEKLGKVGLLHRHISVRGSW